MEKRDKLWTILFLVLLGAGMIFAGVSRSRQTGKIVFREHLEETVLTVDEQELTLGELALYIAYEEQLMDQEAHVYNYQNPTAYWKVYLNNGGFLKLLAKQAVIDMAVHDEIFYQQAKKDQVTLDEEERKALELKQEDFWNDLDEEQRDRLGVTRAQLDQALEKKALAEKSQNLFAASEHSDFEAYSTGERPYKNLLENHTCKINEKLWSRVDFGHIILAY